MDRKNSAPLQENLMKRSQNILNAHSLWREADLQHASTREETLEEDGPPIGESSKEMESDGLDGIGEAHEMEEVIFSVGELLLCFRSNCHNFRSNRKGTSSLEENERRRAGEESERRELGRRGISFGALAWGGRIHESFALGFNSTKGAANEAGSCDVHPASTTCGDVRADGAASDPAIFGLVGSDLLHPFRLQTRAMEIVLPNADFTEVGGY
ncbi:hypothetical protein MA16_Dca004921 [Dendrobium catenatum]|uniref:Uncharacterized protein n=1 Tax=Dendrobium catenatum TaxID=906689 RepID=A0A2I0WGD1_9ASPA|nr:hypothetical protein MA16_Dca004921 [Dendrobium catenatum]